MLVHWRMKRRTRCRTTTSRRLLHKKRLEASSPQSRRARTLSMEAMHRHWLKIHRSRLVIQGARHRRTLRLKRRKTSHKHPPRSRRVALAGQPKSQWRLLQITNNREKASHKHPLRSRQEVLLRPLEHQRRQLPIANRLQCRRSRLQSRRSAASDRPQANQTARAL